MTNVKRQGCCDCGDPDCPGPGAFGIGVLIEVAGRPAGMSPMGLSGSGGGGDGMRSPPDLQRYPRMGLPEWAWRALMQALAARPVVPLKGPGHRVPADKSFCVVCGMTDLQILSTGRTECTGMTDQDAKRGGANDGGSVWQGPQWGVSTAGGIGRDGTIAGGMGERYELRDTATGCKATLPLASAVDYAIADAVLALINRTPTTPSRDEIAAAVWSARGTARGAVESDAASPAKEVR